MRQIFLDHLVGARFFMILLYNSIVLFIRFPGRRFFTGPFRPKWTLKMEIVLSIMQYFRDKNFSLEQCTSFELSRKVNPSLSLSSISIHTILRAYKSHSYLSPQARKSFETMAGVVTVPVTHVPLSLSRDDGTRLPIEWTYPEGTKRIEGFPFSHARIHSFSLTHLLCPHILSRAQSFSLRPRSPTESPTSAVILYVHGGGYCLGSIKTHRRLVSFFARASASQALAVDYRLAPEHPYPAALEDAMTVGEGGRLGRR